MKRGMIRAVQLQLEFATQPQLLTSEEFVRSLARRGCKRVAKVRFKKNRGRIISLAKDGRTLHIHACFQEANDEAMRAIATFLKAGPRSYAYRAAIRSMRDFFEAHAPRYVAITGEAEDKRVTHDVQRLPCVGTSAQRSFLREAYSCYDAVHFGGRLPQNVRLRLSDRMRSRLGHVRYHTNANGERIILELALNSHLLLPGNEAVLLDTLLHEMTHVEAWLTHAERAHGRAWKAIAKRVGCEARACSTQPIRRRRKGNPVTETPDRAYLPPIPVMSEGSAA